MEWIDRLAHSVLPDGFVPAGICPLDADLSLPPCCYSDLLREWAADGAIQPRA